MRIKLIQSNQSEMVSYFHENLNKRIGAVAQTAYTDVYNCVRGRLHNIDTTVKAFLFLKNIRQANKDNRSKEYEPGLLLTYRNDLRRYFFDQPCTRTAFNPVYRSGKHAFLEEERFEREAKGFGNKSNVAKLLKGEDIKRLWESGIIGLDGSRAQLQ